MPMSKRYIVTGGGGFVGKAIIKALHAQGHAVVSISRGHYADLAQLGVEQHQIDIGADSETWQYVCKGATGVFHTAAKVDMWGKFADFYRTNVQGTKHLLDACVRHGVENFVFTSSPSVIHDGNDLREIDESYPYPKHFHAPYPHTKALAEQMVREANSNTALKTVSLRPHLIWGPDDTNLIPTVVERAQAGRLTRVGDGTNRVDVTFIDDCVSAHLLAMQALEDGNKRVFGKVYFVSQGEPVVMWKWIDQILDAHNLPPVTRSISKPLASVLARGFELIASLGGVCGKTWKPLLTRFLVSEMASNHYFSIEAAKNDFGFVPAYSIAEAMEKTFGRRE